MDDNRLIELVNRGCKPAFGVLYTNYYRYVFASIIRSFDEATTEDLVSDVFVRVLARLESFRFDDPDSSFKKWLSSVISSVVCDHIQKTYARKKREQLSYESQIQNTDTISPSETVEVMEDKQIVDQAFDILPEHMRQIAKDHLIFKISRSKIAIDTGIGYHRIRHMIEISKREIAKYLKDIYR